MDVLSVTKNTKATVNKCYNFNATIENVAKF